MKKNKIPGSIIAFLVLLIVFVIILVALVVPTITKLPKYNEDHATISAQIADCDDVLANQTSVEAKIDEMTQQYNENQEALYIDAKSSVEDLQSIFADLGIDMSSLNRGESIQDDQGRTSKGGVLEQESKGCYFINSLIMSPMEDSSDYSTSFDVTLYYFDSTKQVATTAPTEPTT